MKPVYPEILTPDNTLSLSGVNNGDGTVTISIAEGQEFLIQDVKINTTGRTDLSFTVPIPTTAGQVDTYHLRYSLNGKSINNHIPNKNSFYLISVVDTNYNPNSVDESDEQFDTKYDDMLIAKVEIADTGTITIIPLKNKSRLIENFVVGWAITSTPNDVYPPTVNIQVDINWSRKPVISRGGIYNEYIQNVPGERSSLVIPELTSRYVIKSSHSYETLSTTSDSGRIVIYAEA